MSKTKTIELELEQEFIVLAVPRDSVEIEINAKIYKDGELLDVSRTMSMDEVREAIQEAKDCYIPSDAIFTLTDLGKEYAEELIKRYTPPEEDCV